MTSLIKKPGKNKGSSYEKNNSTGPKPVIEDSRENSLAVPDNTDFQHEKSRRNTDNQLLTHIKEGVAENFLDVNFYRTKYSDLIFDQHEDFVHHFVYFGYDECRDPNLLMSYEEFKRAGVNLSNWLLNPDYASLPSSTWIEALKLLALEPNAESCRSILKLIRLWNIKNKQQAELLFFIFSHETNLDNALSGKLPVYFDFCFESNESEINRFHQWVQEFDNNNVSFTSIFDEGFYSKKYQDLGSNLNKFKHFITYGCKEKRCPTPFFDDYLYSRSDVYGLLGFYSEKEGIPDYAQGIASFINRNSSISNTYEFYKEFKAISSLFDGFFENYQILSFFFNLVNVDYIRCLDHEFTGSYIEVLEKWLKKGCLVPFSPFFCKNRNNQANVNWFEEYVSWYELYKEKFIPTDLFDENFYRTKYIDLLSYPNSVFIHFVNHGQFENRQPHSMFDLAWIASQYNTKGKSAVDFYFSCESEGASIKPAPALMGINAGLSIRDPRWKIGGVSQIVSECKTMDAFNFSPDSELFRTIRAAADIDPQIKPIDPNRAHALMPYNTDAWGEIRSFSTRVGRKDVLIFRDGINFGGADVVLKHCYDAWKKTGLSIAIVSTGDVDYKVVESHGIELNDLIDLSDVKGFQSPYFKEHLVYDIIVGSCCRNVVNVNSGILWSSIEKYGHILNLQVSFTAFMFCDDQDVYGNVDGYPTRYFIDTIRYLDKLFVDSEYLKKILSVRSCSSDFIGDKVEVLYTPVNNELNSSVDYIKRSGFNPKAIAWAGRFDEQKCPRLLKSIAEAMPDIEFYVWGKAVLSRVDYKLDEVNNIKLMGLYNDVKEIADSGCALYLYTSLWDGVPTALLRIQELGLPIVASNVGGVSEAVPTIGLVEGHDTSAYIQKIRMFLGDIESIALGFDEYKEMVLKTRTDRAFTEGLIGEKHVG